MSADHICQGECELNARPLVAPAAHRPALLLPANHHHREVVVLRKADGMTRGRVGNRRGG